MIVDVVGSGAAAMASKRMFHHLTYDSRLSRLEKVCDYELGDLSSLALKECKTFVGRFGADVKLWVERGAPTDLLANPLGWIIVSEKLSALIHSFAGADVQVLPVPIYYADSELPVKGYRLVNILRTIAAIDISQSVTSEMTVLGKSILNIIKPAFRADLIPADVHIFRPSESLVKAIVSDELAQAMVEQMVGVAFIRTKTV